MKTQLLAFCLLFAAGAGLALGVRPGNAAAPSGQGPDALRPGALPAAALELLEAVPFVLEQPFVHEWRAEQPEVRAGYLLALRADPDWIRPRDTYEPVLQVGLETAERCNFPREGDTLVALVPAPLDAQGRPRLDLEQEPIFFGALELPERMSAPRLTEELARARARGIGPAAHGRALGLQRPGTPQRFPDRRELERTLLADLIERWSPAETDLVAGLRLR